MLPRDGCDVHDVYVKARLRKASDRDWPSYSVAFRLSHSSSTSLTLGAGNALKHSFKPLQRQQM